MNKVGLVIEPGETGPREVAGEDKSLSAHFPYKEELKRANLQVELNPGSVDVRGTGMRDTGMNRLSLLLLIWDWLALLAAAAAAFSSSSLCFIFLLMCNSRAS